MTRNKLNPCTPEFAGNLRLRKISSKGHSIKRRAGGICCGLMRFGCKNVQFRKRHPHLPYEDASLRYTGIESHEGLIHYGLYDTVVARE